MRHSSLLFTALALFVSLGIGVDNAVNTFYFLQLEHWPPFWCWAATLSSMLLNGLLYHTGAKATLLQTKGKIMALWHQMRPNNPRKYTHENAAWHAECVALGSAITMYGFTLFHYQSCSSWIPTLFSTTFSLCYFVGTYTLILQAYTRPLKIKWIALKSQQKWLAGLLWCIMALATVAAGCQWWSGLVGWLPTPHMNLMALGCCACLMLGESLFIAHIAIDLACQIKVKTPQAVVCKQSVNTSYKMFVCSVLVVLNAAGFAGMTQFNSWVSQVLMGQSAWLLGFTLSLLIMWHTALHWQKMIGKTP